MAIARAQQQHAIQVMGPLGIVFVCWSIMGMIGQMGEEIPPNFGAHPAAAEL